MSINPRTLAKSSTTEKHERKTFPVFVMKADAQQGVVEAIVSVFGVIDMMDDVIHPGAYSKTIQERKGKIRVLDNHRTESVLDVLGKPLSMREMGINELPNDLLARYPDATGGLLTVTQFNLNTIEGKGAFERILNGDINEWSIGFDVIKWDKSKVKDSETGQDIYVRNIREIRLWEYSPVIWGANEATWTIGAKSENLMSKNETNPTPEPEATTSTETKAAAPTIGNEIKGAVYDKFMAYANSYYKCGLINATQHRTMVDVGTNLLDTMDAGIPLDVSELTIDKGGFDMMFWAAEGARMLKTMANTPSVMKAGRVLSKTNVEKLLKALEEIESVLSSAGLFEEPDDTTSAEEADESKSAEDVTEIKQAESPTALTFDTDALTAQIKQMREAMKGS